MEKKKKAFIFDLDDTLAATDHRHHLMEQGRWDEYYALCSGDKPIVGTCAVVIALHARGYHILFVTGRSDSVRGETLEWLNKHVCPGVLYMRREGDFRPNSTIKREILCAIQREYEVLMVFDDQPAACKMWREAGLRCAQVANGAEFVEHIRAGVYEDYE